MLARYVNELTDGAVVDGAYAIRSKEVRTSRAGDSYLALELADKTGSVPATLFGKEALSVSLPVGAVAHVRGRVTRFKGLKRISVDEIGPAHEFDSGDFVARSPRDLAEMVAEFGRLVRTVKHPKLREVLKSVFAQRPFFEEFCECPAAQSYHHAYLGGLLEHTIAVAALCETLAERYPGVDTDLLVSAALLHDIGKVDELDWSTAIAFTDEGRLVGHVVLGVSRVQDAARRVGLSSETAQLLVHAVLSHHGELEWGSPKRPCTLESLLLHHVDNLDAKAAGMSALVSGAVRADELWTDAGNLFRRPLHAPRTAEDDRPSRATEDDDRGLLSA
jgi:3'-5' exoribonuclease